MTWDDKTPVEEPRVPVMVLLVEDNDADADLFAEVCAGDPLVRWSVARAKTLRSALEMLGSIHPGLCVVDPGLPDASSTDAVLMIARATHGRVPIMILSGYGPQEDAHHTRTLLEAAQGGGSHQTPADYRDKDDVLRRPDHLLQRMRTLKAVRPSGDPDDTGVHRLDLKRISQELKRFREEEQDG